MINGNPDLPAENQPLRPTSLEAVAILLAVVPFALIYLAHFASSPSTATGFVQYDMPYYAANGRAVFERGNGICYPNPYDSNPDAPVVYFHWFVWLLGAGIVKCGFDPGYYFVTIGLISAVLMSWLTLTLVKQMLDNPQLRIAIFFVVIWGGGLLCCGRIIDNIVWGQSLLTHLLKWDPGNGLWFLNWGRNLMFPTEATYHALMAASWLCALRGQWSWSLVCAGLLAATHPWSGLEALCAQTSFWSIQALRDRKRTSIVRLVASVVLLGMFLGYNLVFLDSVPEHRALHTTWQLDWSLQNMTILLAWGPVGLLALLAIIGDATRPTRRDTFLLMAFVVAFLLSIHDRFMKPTQPLHFTRGYVWMPLCLIGLPLLQRTAIRIRQSIRPTVFVPVAALFCLMAFSDNVVFVTNQVRRQFEKQDGFHLSIEQQDMFAAINREELDGVCLCTDADLGYLLATWTRLRPWLGHKFNTPDAAARNALVAALLDSSSTPADIDFPANINLLLIRNRDADRIQTATQATWSIIHRNRELQLLERRVQNVSPAVEIEARVRRALAVVETPRF